MVLAPGPSSTAVAPRVVLFQRALPEYRVPVFSLLSERLGGRLEVVHGTSPELGVAARIEGFRHRDAVHRESRRFGLAALSGHLTVPLAGRFDVAVLAWEARCVTLPLAIARCRAAGLGVVLWGQGFSKSGRGGMGVRLRNRLARAADALVVYDDRTAQDLAFLERPVFVARNTVHVPVAERERARHARQRRLARRQSLPAAVRPLSLLVCTRLQERNRLDVLADAARSYHERHGPVQVTLVGADHWPGGLAALRERFGPVDWRALGPVHDPARLAELYADADLAVVPDAVGLSVVHAFAHGVPLVTAAGRGPHGPEFTVLEDGVNGLVYARGNSAALTDALARGAAPDFLERAGHAAAHCYDADCSPERMVDGLLAAVAASRRPSPSRPRSTTPQNLS